MRIQPSRTDSAVCCQSSGEDELSGALISLPVALTSLPAPRGWRSEDRRLGPNEGSFQRLTRPWSRGWCGD